MNTIRTFTIHDNRGHWVGDFVLVHDEDAREGSYYSITDYGNYSYRWGSVPKSGFLKFLAGIDVGYMIEKLGMGHDELVEIDVFATREKILAECREAWSREDADAVGEATIELERCDTMCDIWSWAWARPGLLPGDPSYFIGNCAEHRLGGKLRGYRDHVIPKVKEYLKELVARSDKRQKEAAAHGK